MGYAVAALIVFAVAYIVWMARRVMKAFAKHLAEPLNSIKEHPYQFALWWLVANIFGLAGFLLPILFCWARGKYTHELFISSIKAGNLASFSVVLLAEGIASILIVVGAQKSNCGGNTRTCQSFGIWNRDDPSGLVGSAK